MLAFWTAGAVALQISASMRVHTQLSDMPVVIPADAKEDLKLLTTTMLIHSMADVKQALQQPYLTLKEELGFWMNLKQPGIFATHINIYNVEEIVNSLSPDYSRRFAVTWFLHNSDTELTKEKASSTTIRWRWTNLPWLQNSPEGTKLVTTLWVNNDLAKNGVVLTNPYQMVKDELVFWMQSLGKKIHRKDITISKVDYKQWEFGVGNSKKYEITWNLNYFNGVVSKEDAKKSCIWRNENTFDRHEMTEGLVTFIYFDWSFNEHNVVTNPDTRDQNLKDILAAEFQLRASAITINDIEKQVMNDVYGGRRYRVTWAGHLPKDEANKVIEWGGQNVELMSTTVLIDPNADVQQVLSQPYMMLKDELAFWLNMKVKNAKISANDINIIAAEKNEGTPTDRPLEFIITWFLFNFGEGVTKEQANSTKIHWRPTNLPWVNPPEGTPMLVTTFWVNNDLAKNGVVLTKPYQMVKDELVFWMQSLGKNIHRKDITISNVDYKQWEFGVGNSKKYEISWYVPDPKTKVSKNDAKINCVWRNENTFDRHEMVNGLTTTIYFDAYFNDVNFVKEKLNARKIEERLATEFELRTADVTVTNIEDNHVYDVHGGTQYIVTWAGRLPTDEANVVIEWSKPNK